MDCTPTDVSPCGEPECLRSNSKILKFTKLSEEKQQIAMDSRKNPEVKVEGKSLKAMYMPKLRRPSVCSMTYNPSIASSFLASHASTTNASCIIDPLNVLKKRPLNTIMSRRNSKEDMNSSDSSCLAEALKNFDKQGWVTNGNPTTTSATPIELPSVASIRKHNPTSSHVEARTVSSSYISVHEDYDENYHEASDAEIEIDHDADVYPVPDHYVTEAKSKDSLLNILYEDALTKKPTTVRQQSNSDVSNDSNLMESGYRSNNSSTTTPRIQQDNSATNPDSVSPLSRCVELVSSTPARVVKAQVFSDIYPICRPYLNATAGGADSVATSSAEDSSEQISKLIVDLIGPNSRVGKLIFQSCTTGQDVDCIYEEIKQCVQAELQMEDKLASFFRKATPSVPATTSSAVAKCDPLQRIDDTLLFVKEHLSQIRADINEFKEHSYKKIDSKVSYTEFSDTTAILRAKMTYLERKLFNEHRIMRQDIRNFREKITFLENEAACGLKNFPVWPVLAFVGVYSIINLGRR